MKGFGSGVRATQTLQTSPETQLLCTGEGTEQLDAPITPSRSGSACIECMSVREFSLPLRQPVTTGSTCSHRHGYTVLLRMRVASGELLEGSGEASPLPGLHAESQQTAAAQLAALSQVLKGITVPENVCLLGGELEQWWEWVAGVAVASLLPSVRFAVESALVAAMAHACGAESLAEHLFLGALSDSRICMDPMNRTNGSSAQCMLRDGVAVNALMDLTACTAQQVAEQATALQEAGYASIKVKVRLML